MSADAPKHTCSMCNGTGYKYGKTGLGHGAPNCDWCDGLGSVFTDIILRGHPVLDGYTDVLDGRAPGRVAYEHDGATLIFERAAQPTPPFWFIKEDGKQVYRYAAKLEAPVTLPT